MIAAALCLAAAAYSASPEQPLQLHPRNPHYFLFRGKPAVLITSGEHYGAVINRPFQYTVYLDELAARHLNLTRTWAGAYREVAGDFNIPHNTLAPLPQDFVCPWPRSTTPGANDGQPKFDLSRWNDAYFSRLHDFMREASKRGIVVELNLFCPFYEDSMWKVSPMNAANNVNGVGRIPKDEAYTLKHPDLLARQDALVRKMVAELKPYDNLYYEICNEPYFGGVAWEWQKHIAGVIADADRSFPARHLISRNVQNGSTKVDEPLDLISLYNWHYSRPPESVAMNYPLNRALGNNETGFDGTADSTYRIQGWDYLIAGGALYNNLDYSFVVGHEKGDFTVPPTAPGGGSPALRAQLGYLHDFLNGLDFLAMSPHGEVLKGGVPAGASARVLAQPGDQYALYLHHGRVVKDAKPRYQVDAGPHHATLWLDLPAGRYSVSWLDPRTGKIAKGERLNHKGGVAKLPTPEYREDLALKLTTARSSPATSAPRVP
ncbi:MAG: cellulase family glycosylhydrolase [Bryobacteraceae bacterium]